MTILLTWVQWHDSTLLHEFYKYIKYYLSKNQISKCLCYWCYFVLAFFLYKFMKIVIMMHINFSKQLTPRSSRDLAKWNTCRLVHVCMSNCITLYKRTFYTIPAALSAVPDRRSCPFFKSSICSFFLFPFVGDFQQSGVKIWKQLEDSLLWHFL